MKKYFCFFIIFSIIFFCFPFQASAVELDFNGDAAYWNEFCTLNCRRGSGDSTIVDYPNDVVIFRDGEGYYWFVALRGDASSATWHVRANSSTVSSITSLNFQLTSSSAMGRWWVFKSVSNVTTARPSMSATSDFMTVENHSKSV